MVAWMRKCCELCAALGVLEAPRGMALIGVAVGARDALLCTEHALFALDSDVGSLEELREVFDFVNEDAPARSGRRPRPASVRARSA
jgi:hypothetical protein